MSRVIVISPHPDDESIGCGGSLRKHVLAGDEVRVIFVTSGERGGPDLTSPERLASLREQEARAACEILGATADEFWHQPDGKLRATNTLVERLRLRLEDWRPDILYVPHQHEMHPDHRASVNLVRRALSAMPAENRPNVLMFEVWTPMQQIDRVVDISLYIDVKLAAIRAHKSQCAMVRYDEAAEALNRYRGEMHSGSQAARHAEVFTEPQWGVAKAAIGARDSGFRST